MGVVCVDFRGGNRQQSQLREQGRWVDHDFREIARGRREGGIKRVVDVVGYADPVRTPGLVVMDTPGFDPVSVTGIVAGGANVMVFTTGRGSVLGCKPTPTIKVATNTPMYEHMKSDMDFDAGVVLAGVPIEEVGQELFEMILAVASGERTKSERQGLGDDEFAPWTIGPIL